MDELRSCSASATSGGAIFAWANAAGIIRFLEAPDFKSLVARGPFSLVVGLDAITDPPAVRRLIALDTALPNLSVRAFLNEATGLFHPKLAWFESPDVLALVVGSGNLTKGGLQGNWEAFITAELRGSERVAVRQQLLDWETSTRAQLQPIGHPSVMDRASKNVGLERTIKRNRVQRIAAIDSAPADEMVLLAEAPKQTNRQGQMNVPLRHYVGFFGFLVGTTTTLRMQLLDDSGATAAVEVRQSVQVASHNYRIELAGLRGITYDTTNRPIGAFLHTIGGVVLYMILTPASPHYACVSALLTARNESRPSELRRARVSATELATSCPELPLLSTD